MEPLPLLLRTLILYGAFNLATSEICDELSYTLLDNPRRSTQAVHDASSEVPLCDYGISEETWFRFLSYSGDAVAEREASNPVEMMRCGTQAPIYIRGIGSHPVTNHTTTNATVCAHFGGDACKWTDTIQIYRCPAEADPNYFFLYKLQSPPGCSLSYCAGEEPACNQDDYWNGYSCVNYIPVMTEYPVFNGPQLNGSNVTAEIYFTCEVKYERQPNDSNARFRVTFLFDGQPLEDVGQDAIHPPERLEPTILLPDDELVVILGERHLRGRLGKEISCQAESYWDDCEEATSIMKSIGKYYAAFESTVESFNISLSNGSTHDVTFKSTLPFTCSHCSDFNEASCCEYKFQMVEYNVSAIRCFLIWMGGETASMTTYFVPGTTQTENSYALVFDKYMDMIYAPSLWHDYLIPTVKMTILPQSIPYKLCHSVTDPHLMTFDGAYYNNYLLGDFYLAKATLAEQIMEIQVRHETCNGGEVTCNCGVIVREGNSVIKISICEAGEWNKTTQRRPTVVRLLSQTPQDSSTVYIDGTGLIFNVRMPSGLRVDVDATLPWFSIYVNLPPEYHGQTDSASMCGNSNGNSGDDSTTNLELFRVPDNLNYFKQQPNCSEFFNVAATRCGCNGTYPICSNTDPTLEAMKSSYKPYSGNYTSEAASCQMTAVATDSSLYDSSDSDFTLDNDSLYPPYTYDPNLGVNVSFTWPTPRNKTLPEVEKYCFDMLNSSAAFAECSAKVDIATITAMCVSDIQIADDWISISAYLFFFEQTCLTNIAASITSSDSTANDALKSVSAKLCPNQCSGHGTCADAICTCDAEYIGADCSIDQSLPPSLTGIIRAGVCDVRARPCDVISVYGSRVASSSALKCRFTDQDTGGHAETNGTFLTAVEYSCPVPETTTHRRRRSATSGTSALSVRKVSITIDGDLYSNTLDFVLFDSVCMECSTSNTCRQTDNSCLISDQCFADKSSNPDNSCLQCVPSSSRTSWTDVTVVEDWSSCTRECDTGVTVRNTVCGTQVTNEEVEFCKELNCPGNAEQTTQGFGITLSPEDLKLILIDPAGSLVPFSDALNQYCSKNATECCKSIGMETKASSVAYTSPDHLTYASGYPIISTTDASLKIIVKIDRAKLVAECSQTQTPETNVVYGAPNLLYDAITSEEVEIEKALSITITSVWSPTSAYSTAPRTTTSVSTMVSILIGLCVFVVLVWNNHL